MIAPHGARRAVRALAGVLLGLPVGAAVILAAAGSARAADATLTITCPSPDGSKAGQVVSGSTACSTPVSGTVPAGTVAISATCAAGLLCGASTFTITPPKADTGDMTISATSTKPSLTETLPAGAANGTWTATLTGNFPRVSTSFVLAVPPSVPGHLSVGVDTPGQATVSWSASSPTPATAYFLDVDGDPTTLTPACNASTCSGTVTGLSGGSHAFSVVATRSDGGSGTIASQPAMAAATVAPVAGATPSSPTSSSAGSGSSGTGSAGSGSGGSGAGGSGSGGTSSSGSTGSTGTVTSGSGGSSSTTTTAAGTAAEAQKLAAAVQAEQKTATSFKSFSPPAGIALLPPLPQLAAAADPDGEPTDPGTYKPTLPYSGTVTERVKTTRTTALGHIQNVVSDRELAESAAAGLLVLLVAGHLRVLARRSDTVDL